MPPFKSYFDPDDKKEELNLEILPEHRIRFWLLDTYFELLLLAEQIGVGMNKYRRQRDFFYKIKGLHSFIRPYFKEKNGKKQSESDKKIITNLKDCFKKLLACKDKDIWVINEDDAYDFMMLLQDYYYMKGFTKLDARREGRPSGISG